jgi:hypothetical protein
MNQYTVTIDGREYDVDAPDPNTAWAWANSFHVQQQAARQQQILADQAAQAERFKADEAARPWLQRAAINLGAGLDTAWQGAKQLVGRGPSDEELREQRALKSQAAENMTGGGLLQVAGEVLPTLAVPAGGFVKGAQALTGGRILKNASLAKKAIADAALAGGVAGALQPTLDNESRIVNTAVGAAGGAAVPAAVQGAKVLRRTLTQAGAKERAADRILRDVGEGEARQAVADIQTYYPKGAEDIPLSTAGVTQNPKIAVLERASRARDPAQWAQLDEATNRAAWQNVQRATQNADELERLRQARSENWMQRQGEASAAVRPAKFAKELEGFYSKIEQALKSPPGQNQMRPVLLEIKRQLDELGPEITPEHMMTLRANMQGAIKGTPDNVFATAPRTDPYYISLKQELDRILNDVTGGKWQKVVEGYAKDSAPVQAAKSAKGIRETFETPEGVLRTGDVGGVPRVTEARLRQALASKGESKFGDALTPESRQRLAATLEALNRQNITQRVKNAGTGGGGSNTLMDTAALLARRQMPASGVIERLWNVAVKRGDEMLQQEIDLLLRDPEAFRASIVKALEAGQPLPRAKAEILAALQRAPGVSLPALTNE